MLPLVVSSKLVVPSSGVGTSVLDPDPAEEGESVVIERSGSRSIVGAEDAELERAGTGTDGDGVAVTREAVGSNIVTGEDVGGCDVGGGVSETGAGDGDSASLRPQADGRGAGAGAVLTYQLVSSLASFSVMTKLLQLDDRRHVAPLMS